MTTAPAVNRCIALPSVDTDEMFDIEQVRARISDVLDDINIPTENVYAHMRAEYRTPENEAQITGWFNGSVKQSPKILVTAFFEAVMKAIHFKYDEEEQICQCGYQDGASPAPMRH